MNIYFTPEDDGPLGMPRTRARSASWPSGTSC